MAVGVLRSNSLHSCCVFGRSNNSHSEIKVVSLNLSQHILVYTTKMGKGKGKSTVLQYVLKKQAGMSWTGLD